MLRSELKNSLSLSPHKRFKVCNEFQGEYRKEIVKRCAMIRPEIPAGKWAKFDEARTRLGTFTDTKIECELEEQTVAKGMRGEKIDSEKLEQFPQSTLFDSLDELECSAIEPQIFGTIQDQIVGEQSCHCDRQQLAR